MHPASSDIISVRALKKAGFIVSNPLPLSIFSVAINEGKAVAVAIVGGGNIRVFRNSQVTLQIAIVEGVHRLIAKDPGVDRAQVRAATNVVYLYEPAVPQDHIGHVLESGRGYGSKVPNQSGVHGNTADS